MEMESGPALSIWVNSIKPQSGGEFGLFQQIQAVLACFGFTVDQDMF